MAQETAGTIGIPVLKNEILPYLTDFAKRRERAELYKQKAEQRAAELEAKRAKEQEITLNLPGATGVGYKRLTDEKIKKEFDEAQAAVADINVPRATARQRAADAKRNIEFYSNRDKQLEKEALDELGSINKNTYYTAPPSSFYDWADKQPDYRPTSEFRASIYSNPSYIDFGKINKKAKDYGMEDITIEDEKGKKTQTLRVSKIFDYEFEDDPSDPFGKAKVPKITGVNVKEAENFIKSDPELSNIYALYGKNRAEQIKSTNPTMSDDEAGAMAIDEFMKKAFPDGRLKYGETFTTPRVIRARGEGRKPEINIGTAGARAHEFEVNGGYEVEDVLNKNDVPYSFPTARELAAGMRIYPLGQLEEFDDVSIFGTEASDGSYPTKAKMVYNDVVETILPFSSADIVYTNPKGEEIQIPKGREIQPTRVKEIEQAYRGRATPISRRKGYEVTGVIGGKRIYGFVPEQYAADIKNDIAAATKKAAPKKKVGFPK